ncbi:MAG TPA: rhodanese-like domain-containing protein [Terriglobales bacterium]|jgi:rhodanese-related sulfurtransferase|nr:rhodanese-like domain-containing protein [Terriglobales bacterium]
MKAISIVFVGLGLLVGCGEKKQQTAATPAAPASTGAATAATTKSTGAMEVSIEITPEEAKQKLDQGEAVLIDVREPWEVQTASVAGAKNIPMGDVASRQQELDPDKNILVLCHHGVRSLKVTNWLREHGFEKAQSVRGGIDAWSKKVDPKVPTY